MATTWLRQWLKAKSPRSRRKGGTPRKLAIQPHLECFEPRIVPAVRTWDCLNLPICLNDNWSNRFNWSGNVAPVNGDDIIFPDADLVSRHSTMDIAGLTVNSITIQGGPDPTFNGDNFDYMIFQSGAPFTLNIGAGGIHVTRTNVDPRILVPLGGNVNKMFTIDSSSSTLSVLAPILGTGGITKAGSGRLNLGIFDLSRLNTYTGVTAVNQGELRVLHPSVLGSVAAGNGTVVASGAVLSVAVDAPQGPILEPLTLSGTGIGSQGALHALSNQPWSGPISLDFPNTEISVVSGVTFPISGQISGTGGLVKRGGGTLQLTGNAPNTYAGSTIHTAGILELNKPFGVNAVPGTLVVGQASGNLNSDVVRSLNGGQLPNNGAVTVNLSGHLDLNNQAEMIGPLTMNGGNVTTGTGTLQLNGNVTASSDPNGNPARMSGTVDLNLATRTFTVNDGVGAPEMVIDAEITGFFSEGLIKAGAGSLVRNNGAGVFPHYTGTTTVNAGTLRGNGNYSGSAHVVNSGGILGGTGTVGPITVNSGGSIRPGDPLAGIGTLTVAGSVTFNNGSAFHVNYAANGTNDQLRVVPPARTTNNSNVVLNGTVNLVSDGALTIAQATGQQYRIIDNQTSGTQGTAFSVNGVAITSPQQTFGFGGIINGFRLNHVSGDGNDVQLTAPGAMVQNLALTPEVVNEGDTVTLTGVGVDDNPNNQYFLMVDWGDGSQTELHQPGHRPFSIPHTYANNPAGRPVGGRYTVFVQWFNQFLAGNNRELFVTVNFSPNQRFVAQVYLDLLERPADPLGLSFFSGLLDRRGVNRTQVIAAIQNSQEYRTRLVDSLYTRFLGRSADHSGLAAWVQFLAQGGTTDQLQAQLLGSQEYFVRAGGNNEGFLNAAYRHVLDRQIEPGGAQIWGQALANGVSRVDVASAILNSLEEDTRTVQNFYSRYLRRAAEPAGLQAFTRALQQGSSEQEVLRAIIGSEEYFSRL
jgi:autotransporter-associated beta strand protein